MYSALSLFYFFVVTLSLQVVTCHEHIFYEKIPEDGRLNFSALATKYGYRFEEHEVITEDGYVLTMFRIPGNESRPVFLQHGSYTSSDDFILRNKRSLAAYLADRGYDVWAGNLRGNRYARKHVRLNPDADEAFWKFGIDEHGMFDLPGQIDYILKKTKQKSLIAMGHSLGATTFFALGADKPEYNDKIKVFVALAPLVFGQYIKNPVKTISLIAPLLTPAVQAVGLNEIFGWFSPARNLIEVTCTQGEIGYQVCIKDALFSTSGADEEEFEPEFLPIMIGHTPAGVSLQLGLQFVQITNEGRFAKFDRGPVLNMEYYNSTMPPEYDLSQMTMDTYLIVGKNDMLATMQNAIDIKSRVPNVKAIMTPEHEQWNHIDFTYARNMDKYLFPLIEEAIKNYE